MTAPAQVRTVSALQLYDEGIRAAVAGRDEPIQLCDDRGRCRPLPLPAWCAESLPGDAALLDRCVGATLDIGCGPGRLTVALGRRALGIDISTEAVALTRRRGGAAVLASVFGPLPAEARWDTVLLADGNIGIGGDPVALLRRCGDLVAPGGRIVVELDPVSATRAQRVQLRLRGRRSEFFDWATVGTGDIAALAADSGLRSRTIAKEADRWFGVLTPV